MSSDHTSKARRCDGSIDIGILAGILQVTEAELLASVGMSGPAVGEVESREVQRRLVVLVDLLERVTPWCGDLQTAYDWYCHHSIVGFGGETARDLVKVGRESAVMTYIDRIADGGYA